MKKNSLLKICSLLILALFSCTKADTPQAVADKFLKAMSVEDYETAKKYGTEETEKLLDMMSGISQMSVDSAKKELKFEISREQIDNDKATVYYKEVGKTGEQELPLVKQEGKWKVLLSKESINNTDDSSLTGIGATHTDTSK